jgi:hypothetical protein
MTRDINGAQHSAAHAEIMPAARLETQKWLLEFGAAWRDGPPLGATRAPSKRLLVDRSERAPVLARLPSLPRRVHGRVHGLARGLVANAAISVIVGLLAALLAACAPASTDARVVASPTAAALPSWSVAPHLVDQPVPPVIAPSDPAVVYEAGVLGDESGLITAHSQRIFRRSDDAGATWRDLSVPDGGLGGYTLDSLALWVDPANAQNVLATLARALPEQGQPACPTNRGAVAFARQAGAMAYTPASGPAGCQLQYFSADGGAHWSELRFPVPGAISNGDSVWSDVDSQRGLRQLQSQGERLYTAIHYRGQDILTRIMVSQDHGATWNLADGGLYGEDRGICEFLAAPDAATLFATTGAPACDQLGPYGSITLWRSDDAGAHWMRLGPLPDTSGQLIGAFTSPGQADFALYIITEPVRGRGYQHAWASEDGGRGWQAAPDPGAAMFLSEPHDGSFISVSSLPYRAAQATPATAGTRTPSSDATQDGQATRDWRPGQASWRPIARPPLNVEDVAQIVDTIESYVQNGRRSLWAVIASRNPNGEGMVFSVRVAQLS